MTRRILLVSSVWLLSTTLAAAQGQQTGTLQGTVTDASAAALPGVSVTARSAAVQGTRDTVTGPAGDYVLRGLPPGSYEVTFELNGFTTGKQSVTVSLGLPAELKVQMQPAGVTESIQVVGRTDSALVTPAGSANYSATEIDTLATGRTIAAIAEARAGPDHEHAERRSGDDFGRVRLRQRVPGRRRRHQRQPVRQPRTTCSSRTRSKRRRC